jgi:uncharacterized membrane protein
MRDINENCHPHGNKQTVSQYHDHANIGFLGNSMKKIILLLTLFCLAIAVQPAQALNNLQQTEPVIIYLFWGDGCPHCAIARPALHEFAARHENIELREYEVWHDPDNQVIFVKIMADLGLQPRAVPTIIIGKHYWEGYGESTEAEMEAVIADCLRNSCPDPGIGLVPEAITTESQPAQSETDPIPVDTAEPSPQNTATIPDQPEVLRSNGFVLAIFVMVFMAAALVYSMTFFAMGKSMRLPAWSDWLIPALIVIGIGVAGYLSYVETQEVEAVCGPVGDCNTVQTSPYATLFGFLPVGVLGLLGYIGLLAAWLARKYIPKLEKPAAIAYYGMAFFAVVFSLYLTYLEPFVIKAVCAWCLTSAVIVTLLLLLGTPPVVRQFSISDEDE